MKAAERHGMAIASQLEDKGRASMADMLKTLSFDAPQFKAGIQWFRRHGGVALGYTIVYDAPTDQYVLCDELGNPTDNDTLVGYDVSLNKGIASRTLTALAVSITSYNRAVIADDTLAIALYRKRCRGMWTVCETYAEEADRLGDTKERERIEVFLATIARP